jgi:phosphopantetheinyl transferase
MALSKIVKINEKLRWALWEIEESGREREQYNSIIKDTDGALSRISHPQKKSEFMASRLALHQLLKQDGQSAYRLSKDKYGKPYLENSPLHISLAHAYPFAVAAVSHSPVGIDIEKPSEKLRAVRHKFLHEEEHHFSIHQLDTLCQIWCAKESIYKLYGRKKLSFRDHIRVERIHYPDKPYLQAAVLLNEFQQTYRLKIESVRDFFILFNV